MLTFVLYAGHKVSLWEKCRILHCLAKHNLHNSLQQLSCAVCYFLIMNNASPLPSPPSTPLSIVRSHSVHLCSRCAKPNYMACNKGRSKFSYNLWQQRIKKDRRGRERGGGGSEQKSNYKMGCCTRCAHFRCAEG